MFTIEHGFDATTVTLVDDNAEAPLKEDIVINIFEDGITVDQWDVRTDTVNKITLSLTQMQDLAAALDLPEGVYQIQRDT